MIRRHLRLLIVILSTTLLATSTFSVQNNNQPNDKNVPKPVMDSLKAKFPQAKIQKWSKEKEGDIIVYDFEFKQQGQKFEADIKEDGTIHNWEREIAFKDLPHAVKQAVENKYPKSTPRETMQITAVNNGKDELEGYEIVLKTADKKEVEVTVAPDGRILEESSDKK